MHKILFTFTGIVKHNLGRGRKLGYPTANIDVPATTPEGLFVGITKHKDKVYQALIFIGPAVTFEETDKKAEIYILDFDEDIYGETLTTEILHKLRDNEKFTTVEALIEKMRNDEINARNFFNKDKK